MSTKKSNFRTGLDELTPEQFQLVEKEIAAAKAERGGGSAEFNQRVANMSEGEFQRLRAEINR